MNVVIMGQDCEKFLPMCLKSVECVDNIIYCDGGSTDSSIDIAKNFGATIIENPYDQTDKGMNGKQRNFYLNHLKKNHLGSWALVLDADEVVDDITKIIDFVNSPPKDMRDIISVQMRHFIESFGQEDATMKVHHVPHRLFKVKKELIYPESEHSVLWETKEGKPTSESDMVGKIGYYVGTTIWHLAYCPGVFDIRKRYLNHKAKSEIHTQEFLDDWYYAHLFGTYPKRQINAMEIPDVILNEFLIDKDMLYFGTHNRLETKHFIMGKQWIDHFNPKTVLDLGCGLGLFGYALNSYGIDYTGMEKSQWAVDNTTYRHLNIEQGDISEWHSYEDFDLVLVFDVLEHLEEKDLDKVLSYIKTYGKDFIFSIPYIGDPNLDLDPTHRIKKSKEWWVNELSKHFIIKEVLESWMFNQQMLIGESK